MDHELRYSRSRFFADAREHLTEDQALRAPQCYRVFLKDGVPERAEYLQRGQLTRVVYVRAEPLDDALLASHRASYGGVAIDIDTPQRRDGELRTRTLYQYDGEGALRQQVQTFLSDRGDLVREIRGVGAERTIIEYEHDGNHVLLRSVHKRDDGSVAEVYDWLADKRLGM